MSEAILLAYSFRLKIKVFKYILNRKELNLQQLLQKLSSLRNQFYQYLLDRIF